MTGTEILAMYKVCAAMASQINALSMQLEHVMDQCERYLKTEDDDVATGGCQHPEDNRIVSAGMGGTEAKWMCGVCGGEFEGSPNAPVKPEEPA